ncbi:MAG: TraB/GumN family protein [Myxococcota bacterium]|nr:TraB/GumN family protein [Myxococcota bacterium]
MRPVARALALVVAAVLASACASSQPRCTIDVPGDPAAAPFLWKVHRDDGPVVWLYGTIHNGSAADVPAIVWPRLAASARFASELGDVPPDAERLVELARLPGGKGLDHQLATDDWWELRDTLRGVVREDDLRRARPWYAMARLNATLAPPPSPTMDVALAERARRAGITVDALETWEAQLATLAGAVTIADLTEAIRARTTMRCELAGLRAFYVTGDDAAMQKLLASPRSESLLVARNRAWLPKLEAYLAEAGAFVAVGLGHLIVGDATLPALLQEAGYTVTRATTPP